MAAHTGVLRLYCVMEMIAGSRAWPLVGDGPPKADGATGKVLDVCDLAQGDARTVPQECMAERQLNQIELQVQVPHNFPV